jgi:iron complex transport system substrate-binding protein
MKTTNIITFLLWAVVAMTVASCSTGGATTQTSSGKDREGNPITLPPRIDRIISMGPSNTEILIALGFADRIIATDTYSQGIPGLAKDVLFFDMLAPNGEQIVHLEPDVIFVTGMSKAGGADPYKVIADMGVCLIYIPSSSSIDGIKEDIRFIAGVMEAAEQGDQIIADMEREIDRIKAVGETITARKTVYFEISVTPYLYSFGKGVFLNEMLEIIGAENILADQQSWVAIADEVILKKNPDIILTNVDYLDAPVKTIMSRPGWDKITAIQNRDVYYVDADASSRPSHNIVKTLHQMAKCVYPDRYTQAD